MTITSWFVIVFAILALGVLGSSLWLRHRASKQRLVHPVDLDAFRTVMDRDDEQFLREKLPNGKFRRVKRQRITVARKYVSRISSNIAITLLRVRAVFDNGDPESIKEAARAADLATEIQRQCLVMYAKLAVEFVLPSMQLSPVALAARYEILRESVNRLGRLQAQRPALPGLSI
jgi:hypothetical protein